MSSEATKLETPMSAITTPNWTQASIRRAGNAACSQLPSQIPTRKAASITVKL